MPGRADNLMAEDVGQDQGDGGEGCESEAWCREERSDDRVSS